VYDINETKALWLLIAHFILLDFGIEGVKEYANKVMQRTRSGYVSHTLFY